MERTMSVEEKIKRAEEIYARRHERDAKESTILNYNDNGKKDVKLFKKLMLQVVACLLIYLIVYTIENNNYIFSKDFVDKAKEILSYDTNFVEMYNNAKSAIVSCFSGSDDKESENQNNQNNDIEKNGVQGDENNEQKDEGVNPNSVNNDVQNNQNGIGGSNENSKEANNSNLEESQNQENNKPEQNAGTEQMQLSDEEQRILTIKNTTSFIKPVVGTISSKYGQREPTTATVPKNHTGTDIAANAGTKIISATDGEVVLASSEGDYGNHLKIQIGEVSIIYAHCKSLYVKQGDKVVQGQEIAEVGSTGNSTGPHLHFEIRLKEQTIDPEKILEL